MDFCKEGGKDSPLRVLCFCIPGVLQSLALLYICNPVAFEFALSIWLWSQITLSSIIIHIYYYIIYYYFN